MMKKYIVNEDNERPVCVNCQSEILDEEYLMIQGRERKIPNVV